MPLKIYNTLTKEKEPFVPIEPGKAKMYVCGVTVYDSCHIGHARAGVIFDVVYRYLGHSDFKVTYARNFTDIDDKIIRRSQELDMDYKALTQKYIQEYLDEMKLLNVSEPSMQPRATENIDEMIRVIQGLIDKGYAYATGGDVYYEVSKFASYGRLSRRSLEEMCAGARISPDEKKTHPEDFALWKAAKPGEPYWVSPWGNGRPGWHIECSCMSMKHLGDSIDIHGGGSDLIFPHHENEIAQSEGFTGKPFAHYWIHNEMIMIEHTKMSKSLGNVFVLRELLKAYPGKEIRFFLLSKHYRTPMDFSFELLNESKQAFSRLEASVARALELVKHPTENAQSSSIYQDWIRQFKECMDDDFNTPKALGIVFRLMAQINQDVDRGAPHSKIQDELKSVLTMLDVLGVKIEAQQSQKISQEIELDQARVKEILQSLNWSDDEVEYLVKARESARRRKIWALADQIRIALREKGVEVQDEKDGAKVIRQNRHS
jgi:cysteinyl-tRNA synthetase